MIKRDELTNDRSCLNKAQHDEPIFVLRANDPLAPALVRQWASDYFDSKKDGNFEVTQAQRDKYREALELSRQMEDWRAARDLRD